MLHGGLAFSLTFAASVSDDVGFEDESENVYEEDFDIEEERTELSVSRYDIPDVFTQKGSQGKPLASIRFFKLVFHY